MTPNSFVKTLTLLHSVLVMGLVTFAGVSLYLGNGKINFDFNTEDTFLLILPVIAITALVLSRIIPQKLLQNTKETQDLKKILTQYQTASIIKYALIECPALIGIVMFMNTSNTAFLVISGVLIIYLLLQKPTKTKIENELKLRGELRNQFMKYDDEID